MSAFILYYYRLRIYAFFIVMICTITLSHFVRSYFHIFLLWFIDLRLGTFRHSHWCNISLASMSANQEPLIRSNPPRPYFPTVPSVRTQRTMELCIVSHYPQPTAYSLHARSVCDEKAQLQLQFAVCGDLVLSPWIFQWTAFSRSYLRLAIFRRLMNVKYILVVTCKVSLMSDSLRSLCP